MFDSRELKAAAIRKGYNSMEALATDLGISNVSMSNKMNGKSDFRFCEIDKMRRLLCLSPDKLCLIFFNDSVEKFSITR